MPSVCSSAFDAASRLPDEQDAVAEWLLAEIAAKQEWENASR